MPPKKGGVGPGQAAGGGKEAAPLVATYLAVKNQEVPHLPQRVLHNGGIGQLSTDDAAKLSPTNIEPVKPDAAFASFVQSGSKISLSEDELSAAVEKQIACRCCRKTVLRRLKAACKDGKIQVRRCSRVAFALPFS